MLQPANILSLQGFMHTHSITFRDFQLFRSLAKACKLKSAQHVLIKTSSGFSHLMKQRVLPGQVEAAPKVNNLVMF